MKWYYLVLALINSFCAAEFASKGHPGWMIYSGATALVCLVFSIAHAARLGKAA